MDFGPPLRGAPEQLLTQFLTPSYSVRIGSHSRRFRLDHFLSAEPLVDLLPGLVFAQTISLLDETFELISAARDPVQIIVREIAPFLFDFPFELLPISFDRIPVHRYSPYALHS